MTNTLAQVLESFRIQREKSKSQEYSDNLYATIPSVIVGARSAKFSPCYHPILNDGERLIYPLYTPVSVLCLEMKTIEGD